MNEIETTREMLEAFRPPMPLFSTEKLISVIKI